MAAAVWEFVRGTAGTAVIHPRSLQAPPPVARRNTGAGMKKPVPGEARKSTLDIIKARYALLGHRTREAVVL